MRKLQWIAGWEKWFSQDYPLLLSQAFEDLLLTLDLFRCY